ncbi:bifunctional diaminohydroxyphosphoribosylaminopyrimidine deaminase/5-amino-6-(5-phosphoribosylamino)uracil reductase RibD [Stappia sp. GBMRC 2046]|uniref:Riboflavin biosynthesis protein RibD n=2 Tax=Stappia sediminis TaxID=2692190 RepID=A0A7X3LY95_9HYPH|nr:bifunctional diaminohydroxyphosphoribosylaminopyrimidine deaminase/5-amino-6-(5-phosphoribosylamino)uracil reductase RibD [Stappia sediminis]
MKVIEKSENSVRPHDPRFMAAAISLAARASGRVWPNPAVGALIVDESDYIPVVRGRGWTQATGGAHAEARALHDAGEAARGATCYVTLEPCSHQGRTGPCAVALAEAGIKRVVVGVADPNPRVSGRGVEILREAGVEVVVGVCEGQAAEHHAGFIRRMRDGRPHVILKLAVSNDGFIGRRDDGQVAITGEDVKRRVHLFRAECDAIMVGIGTAIADNPSLTCRLPGLEDRSPVRVVLDPRADLPLDSKLVRTADKTPVWVIVANDADYERTDALSEKGCSVIRVAPDGKGRISPKVALRALGQRGITKLLLEGGSRIAKSFVEADAVDEAMIYNGAATVGNGGILPFGDRGLDFLDESALVMAPGRIEVGPESCDHYIRKGK